MAQPLLIKSIELLTGGAYLGGSATPSYLTMRGVGQPGDTFQIINERYGLAVFPYDTRTIPANGNWSFQGTSSQYTFDSNGLYGYHAVDTITNEVSPSVILKFGTAGAETLTGPTLGATVSGPTYLFGQLGPAPRVTMYFQDGDFTTPILVPGPAGNDTFIAYVVVPDASGAHVQGIEVAIDGGTGKGDTVVLPIALQAIEAHSSGADRLGGVIHLTVKTADASVQMTGVERLQFTDITLTLQRDPLVDFLYYDVRYSDVAALDLNVRAHYDIYGWHEGRDPNALFSTQGYLSAYGDVRGAGTNPLGHFDTFGWREGRNPSAAFDTKLYLTFNPDVAKSGMDPLVHYLSYGIEEGRKTSPVVGSTLVRDGFDPLYYMLANPDVGLSGMDALTHYALLGAKEGRNPDAFFDTNGYLAQNADVRAAGIDPLVHYETFGWKEGRDPSTHFNTNAYLAANPDVVAAGISPLQHFLQFGAAEGRSGFGDLY